VEKTAKNRLQELNKLFERQPRMAMAKLQSLVRQGKFQNSDMWGVYQLQARYYGLFNDWPRWKTAFWRSIAEVDGLTRERQEETLSNYLFKLHYLPDLSDTELRETSFLYDQFAQTAVQFEHPLARHQHTKLHIGYIMTAIGENVLARFCTHLLTEYDRDHFEVYVYVLTDDQQNEILEKVRQNVKVVQQFSDGQNLHEIAQTIYDDEIDIMFDVEVHVSGGHTLRVLCYKPAPVQISGIGYMSTSGTHVIDYFLGDKYLDPPGLHDDDFAEQIIRLPHSHLCYVPSGHARQITKKRTLHEGIVFASFNNIVKITDDMLKAWAEILRRVPDSRLLIKDTETRRYRMKLLHKRMLQAGIPEDKMTLEGPTADFMECYRAIDILLDTYPYTGGATTCDALYMGVPVVTRYGRRHGSRFGYSLLMNVGLGELAAPDLAGYIERAVALAQDRQLLTALHERLPQMMRESPLMNAQGYVRVLERLYRGIWQKWLRRQ